MNLRDLLSLSIKEGASDLHLSSGLSLILPNDDDLIRDDLMILSDMRLKKSAPLIDW